MEAVDEAFGAGRSAETDPAGRAEPVRVRIRLASGDERADGRPRLRQRWAGERMWVRAGESRGVADIARRTAFARVTPALVRDREHFRYGVLEALTLWMLTALDRQPLHAAALERDGARAAASRGTAAWARARSSTRPCVPACAC